MLLSNFSDADMNTWIRTMSFAPLFLYPLEMAAIIVARETLILGSEYSLPLGLATNTGNHASDTALAPLFPPNATTKIFLTTNSAWMDERFSTTS